MVCSNRIVSINNLSFCIKILRVSKSSTNSTKVRATTALYIHSSVTYPYAPPTSVIVAEKLAETEAHVFAHLTLMTAQAF
jgi:hypothetical protein